MHADASDLREDQDTVVEGGAVAILFEGKGMEAIPPLETREASLLAALHPAEERLIGLVEPGQHILQHMAVDCGVLWELGADGLQFGFLFIAREGDASPLVGGDALL
jgi:hypothetical protein